MKPLKAQGLVAATFTPMNEDGSIDVEKIKTYAEFLKARRVKHIFVNGTTGEGASLSTAERKLIVEEWVKVRDGRLESIIVHVGCNNTAESKELAYHAQTAGADGISCLAPHFFKPQDVGSLVEFCRQVAEAAPDLPFLYYHIPHMTGVNADMVAFCDEALSCIPTFCGLKYSNTNLTEGCILQERLKKQGRMFFGCDEQLLCGIALGMDSAVGSTYNFMPAVYQRLLAAAKEGDMVKAREEQFKAQLLIRTILKHGSGITVLKQTMALSGLDLGPARVPLVNLEPEAVERLKKDLVSIGYFSWKD